MTDPARIAPPESADYAHAQSAQAAAADPLRSAWVEANAGSGKTKVLIDRVARLLLNRPDGREGARPDSILCVTYTKAAASEMQSRLFSRLGDWSVAKDDALRKQLAKLEGRAPEDYTAGALKQARSLFARALETPGGLRIETIHAFCARVLRRFPLEAGVSPGFKEIEDSEADALWRKILAERLEQVVEAHPDALRVVALTAGGRGVAAALNALKFKRQDIRGFNQRLDKTAPGAIADAVKSALNAPAETPEEILQTAMVTDLPEADLKEAIAELSEISGGKSDEALLTHLTALLETSDPQQRYETYMNAIAGSKHDWPAKSNPFTTKVPAGGAVVDLFTRKAASDAPEGREITRLKAVQERVASARGAERSIALLTLGLPILERYQQEKALRGALDFDDLIERTRQLLTRSSAAQWVLYKLDGGLTHILLDEAQDTSPPQWSLINALVEEFYAGLGQDRREDPRTQFVVGDPKQSIYSFQGADQEHFDVEKHHFIAREETLGPDLNMPDMTMSFRSSPEILTFVDEVRAKVPLEQAATQALPPRDADLSRHLARRANQPGRVELWPLEMPNPGVEKESDWTAPTDHMPEDAPRRRLAQKIARHVRSMLERGETVWSEHEDGTWSRRAMQPKDVLILVRTRNELFEALIASLKTEKLPVAGADRLRLLENLGVQDCLNLIRFAVQPRDDLALAEILRGPFCGLVDDDQHLFALAYDRAKGETLWDRLQNTSDAAFSKARGFVRLLLENRDLPAFDFLTKVLAHKTGGDLSGMDRLIQRLGEPVRDPVRALMSAALGRDMQEAASLQAFLFEIEQQNAELKRELGDAGGAIRVMTVHGAKGLQSPLVILPDTSAGTKASDDPILCASDGTPLYAPSKAHDNHVTAELRDLRQQASERESRRLLYVALTRTSDRLIICGTGSGRVKAGYAPASWYRWCLLAMNGLAGTGDDGDMPTIPETTLSYGAELPCLKTGAPEAGISIKAKAPDWLDGAAPAPIPPVRLAAPSHLLDDKSPVARPFGVRRAAALQRGRLIHDLLQTLPELNEDAREAAARRFLSRAPDLSDEASAEILAVTLKTLQHPEFAAVFAAGGRSEAAIVGTLKSGQMINGRVDRLIIHPEEVMIIDYKTDRPAPSGAETVGAAYLVQMAAYQSVLKDLYPGRPVRCALLYTDGPVLIELSDAQLSASLNRV
ncbi:MAG: double-strand break repair helicase AddA [Henriciella sp.]